MEQQQAPTQDEIYTILKAYLMRKGLMSMEQAERGSWTPEHDSIYKAHCQFGLGVVPPINIPTSEETLPVQLVESEVWMEIIGLEPVNKEPIKGGALRVPAPVSSDPDAQDPGAPDPSKINVKANGDMSFMITGVDQPRPVTTEEELAKGIKATTEELSTEIGNGETVTKESLQQAAMEDDDDEDAPDVPPQPGTGDKGDTSTSETKTDDGTSVPSGADDAEDDLDDLDDLDLK